MSLIDVPSLTLVAATAFAAFLSGKPTKASISVLGSVVLTAGLVGTFIGFVSMLANLDDPSAVGPALMVAMLTTLYAATLKLGVDVYRDGASAAVEEPAGALGWAGLGVWLLVVGAAIGLSGDPAMFFSLEALLFSALGGAVIVGLTKASGSEGVVDRLARYMPYVGLALFVFSSVAILGVMDDPSAIGPFMAVGLLGYLYTNVVAVGLRLACPEQVSAESPASAWLYCGASLMVLVTQYSLVWLSIG